MEKILQIFRIGSVNLATSDVVGVCLGCELDTMWRDLANVWFSGALGLRKIDAFCSAFFIAPAACGLPTKRAFLTFAGRMFVKIKIQKFFIRQPAKCAILIFAGPLPVKF